jgi:hypothetical protein
MAALLLAATSPARWALQPKLNPLQSSTPGEARMRTFVRRLVPVVTMALAPMAAMTIATPAVSSAECANGEFWDPSANVCRPPLIPPAA